MVLKVIGAGLGRTGTLSLTLALDQLGFGPCHHMRTVFQNMAGQVPLWMDAAQGKADWTALFTGFESAVDWPAASFYRQLLVVYPDAKFILTLRSPESWLASYRATIGELLADRSRLPPQMQAWHAMTVAVTGLVGVNEGEDDASLIRAFNAHNHAVKAIIPAQRLLVYEVKDGWDPLCQFLDVAVPATAFPRSNDSSTFWDNKPFRPEPKG